MTEDQRPEWRIYYADGSTFDSLQGEPKDAPADGVIVIMQAYWRTGRRIVRKGDWYVFVDGAWRECDAYSVLHRHAKGNHPIAIAGEYICEDRCNEIFQRAFKDPDFPPRRPGDGEHYNWNPDAQKEN